MFRYTKQAIPRFTKPIATATTQKVESVENEKIQEEENEIETLQLKSQRLKQCYDLMILIDDTEAINSKDQSVSRDFIVALVERNFPIIVSRSVVYNVCMQYQSYNPLNYLFLNTRTMGTFNKPLLYSISLTNNDWYCYDHPTADMMLFVPKNYTAQWSTTASDTGNDLMKKCGFVTTHLQKIDFFDPNMLIKHIEGKNKNSSLAKTPIIQSITSMLSTPDKPNQPTWNIYLGGHGTTGLEIAGLLTNDFFELLKSLQKINCSYLHYCSCYAGGINQVAVQKELSSLQVNFIVSTQGINEQSVYGTSISSPPTRFTNFFNATEMFFGNTKAFVQQKQQSQQKDPLAFIVSTIIDKDFLNYSKPFIYLPSAGVFNALTVDQSVKIITNSIARAHEFENKTMNFTDPKIETIIVYPQYIGVPLIIRSGITIVSPMESTPVEIHIFEKIIYQDTLASFLAGFTASNVKFKPVIFAIKQVECLNYKNSGLENASHDLILENMIIQLLFAPNINTSVLDSSTLFNFDKETYQLSLKETFEKDSDIHSIISNKYKNIAAQEISRIKRPAKTSNDLLYDFTSYKLQDYLNKPAKNIDRTLSDIIDLLQSAIDTTTIVQKPGSLQNILLKKLESYKGDKNE